LIRLAHVYGCRVLVDTSGEALRHAVAAAPDLVKPNRAEATWFSGRQVTNAAAAIEVAHEMIHAGARGVAVSLGAEGITWERAGNSARLISRPPTIEMRSTVGCGDAALAGFAVAHARGLSDEDALRLAVACGTANGLAESPGMVDALEVDRIFQQVSAEPLQTDWREVKTGGGAR
jgi:fructose-1-phosphate kinase PfkB-like protein